MQKTKNTRKRKTSKAKNSTVVLWKHSWWVMRQTIKAFLALKYVELHGLHGGVIIYFICPKVYEILLQMFRGTFFLGYVSIMRHLTDPSEICHLACLDHLSSVTWHVSITCHLSPGMSRSPVICHLACLDHLSSVTWHVSITCHLSPGMSQSPVICHLACLDHLSSVTWHVSITCHMSPGMSQSSVICHLACLDHPVICHLACLDRSQWSVICHLACHLTESVACHLTDVSGMSHVSHLSSVTWHVSIICGICHLISHVSMSSCHLTDVSGMSSDWCQWHVIWLISVACHLTDVSGMSSDWCQWHVIWLISAACHLTDISGLSSDIHQ